jgi:hypothetical protein
MSLQISIFHHACMHKTMILLKFRRQGSRALIVNLISNFQFGFSPFTRNLINIATLTFFKLKIIFHTIQFPFLLFHLVFLPGAGKTFLCPAGSCESLVVKLKLNF